MVGFMMTFIAFGQNEKELVFNEESNLIEATYYHDNGVVSQTGTFNLDRELHGEWISYNEEGEMIVQGQYAHGKKIGTWKFWKNDMVKELVYANNAIASVDGVKMDSQVVKN